jgi:hypothetical protein
MAFERFDGAIVSQAGGLRKTFRPPEAPSYTWRRYPAGYEFRFK